ncbi:MAG: cardiolipin synthase B, partial [Acidobacteriota bacterium]
TNFDDRSFELNDEVTLGIWDPTFASELEEIFEKDLVDCDEMELETWKKRPLWHKTLDGMFFLINEQL